MSLRRMRRSANVCRRLYKFLFFQGSLPDIECKVTKNFWLVCNASGYPRPNLVLRTGNNNQQMGLSMVEIKEDECQFFAYNAFGAKTSGVYKSKMGNFVDRCNDIQAFSDVLTQQFTLLCLQKQLIYPLFLFSHYENTRVWSAGCYMERCVSRYRKSRVSKPQ